MTLEIEMVNLTIKLLLKKIVEVCPMNLFYFSVHRVKIGKRWGRFMVVFADHMDIKVWWL